MPTLDESLVKLGQTNEEIVSIVSRFYEDFNKTSKKATLGAAAFKPVVDSITKTSKATDTIIKKSFDNLTNSSFNNTENIVSAIEDLSGKPNKKDKTLGQQKFINEISSVPDALEGVADKMDDGLNDLLGQLKGSEYVASGVEIPEFAADTEDNTSIMKEVTKKSFSGLSDNINDVSNDVKNLVKSGISNTDNIVNAIGSTSGTQKTTKKKKTTTKPKSGDEKTPIESSGIFASIFKNIGGAFNQVIDVVDDFFPVVGEIKSSLGRLFGMFGKIGAAIGKFPFKLFKKIFAIPFKPITAMWGLLRKSEDFNRSLEIITDATGNVFGGLYKTIKSGLKGLGTVISKTFKDKVAGSKIGKMVGKGFTMLGVLIGAGFSIMTTIASGLFSLIMMALPFLLIAAAIGALYLIYKNWDTVTAKFNEYVVEPMKNLLSGVWESIKGFFGDLISSAREFVADTLGESVASTIFGEKDTAKESSDEKEAKKSTPKDQTAVLKESIKLEKPTVTDTESKAELKGINKNLEKLNKTMENNKQGDTIINQPASSNIEDLSTYMVTQ